jgi:hypothetical protein
MKRRGKRTDPELPEAEAKVLPAREALSLISTDPLSGHGVEDLAASDPAGGAPSADEAARLPDTDASASGGGEESVTSDDRTLAIDRTDSATSET